MLDLILKKEIIGPIIIIASAIIIYNIFRCIFKRIVARDKNSHRKGKKATVMSLFKNLVKYILLIVSLLLIMKIYGVNITSFVAGLGIITVVIGLALQDSMKDILSGMSIIFDDYYSVGDWVSISGIKGEVLEFGLRTSKIRTGNGDILCIANRNIDSVVNHTKNKTTLFIDIPTAYEVEISEAEKAINEIIKKVKNNDKLPIDSIEYLGIEEFDSSAINYRIQVKLSYLNQYMVKREINKIIKKVYDENNISIPYTQIEVHDAKII